MNKIMILEATYETIKESIEWGSGCEDGSHTMFVDGIIAMTETLLDKIEPKDKCEPDEDDENNWTA